jgi:hypothetical protein
MLCPSGDEIFSRRSQRSEEFTNIGLWITPSMNNQSDLLALGNLVFTIITTFCALYLSYAALKHSAKPNVEVRMLKPSILACGEIGHFVFEFSNVGHWYARPTAIDVVVFCNFAHEFKLMELRYGSVQEYSDSEVRVGVGKMNFLKARGLKLTYGEEGEEIHVRAKAPHRGGEYLIRISAFSENGVSLKKEFRIRCKDHKLTNGCRT